MAAENQRTGLLKVRSKMLAALDKKFKKDLDWQAFRELDDLLMRANGAINGAAVEPPARRESPAPRSRPGRHKGVTETMGDIGVAAITEAGRPVTTEAMVAYVGARRTLNPIPKRARINVQSAMSHEDRIVSIKWRGGSAWWLKNRELPNED